MAPQVISAHTSEQVLAALFYPMVVEDPEVGFCEHFRERLGWWGFITPV